MQQVNLGIIGAGTVGGGVLAALGRNGPLLASRLGVRLEVVRVAIRQRRRPQPLPLPPDRITDDWRQVVHSPDVHVVVELMGGTTTARDVALAALRHGKSVVTANKALLSSHGEELFAEARANRA
ncbi:MAG: homoserine dehydrogenase, partial [Verrucomicrobiota bacterium]